ncbi:phenol hydroxylase subunit P4 [Acinetobacter lactucae]|uniref:phenol hydroxylase subunit P4 n=1 Tax=Acinetobacter lactucae TaxID=1785128 RepID=UPI00148BF4C4|nr:phenol hydroxylase subunit P4 [Acinetobacter lactucae]
MTVRAIHNNYQFEPLDLQKNYGDQFLLYVGWDHHTLFCSAHAMLASPQQTFGQLIEQQITGGFAQHPDFAKIDWSKVQYRLDGQIISPESTKTLAELGFSHKSLLRFVTPELNGYNDSYV